MSSPTTRSLDIPEGNSPDQIAAFVAAVRGQLNDLSEDEVIELTGGLEADLTDALAEAGALPSELSGDPVEYASELRAAAGLPPRQTAGERNESGPGFAAGIEQGFLVPARNRYAAARRTLGDQPWWPAAREFLVVLRPAWWVVRAWVIVESMFMVTGGGASAVRGGFGGLLVLIGVIIISVQLSRRTPLPTARHRVTVAAWNSIAVLLLLPAMFVSTGDSGGDYYDSSSPGLPGLSLDGEQVTNVFPYDSAGRPLTGIQLYDQDGRPLETGADSRAFYDDGTGREATLVPGSAPGLAPQWNAFPLQYRSTDPNTGAHGPVQPAPQPLAGVPLGSATDSTSQATGEPGTPTATPVSTPTSTAGSSEQAGEATPPPVQQEP